MKAVCDLMTFLPLMDQELFCLCNFVFVLLLFEAFFLFFISAFHKVHSTLTLRFLWDFFSVKD